MTELSDVPQEIREMAELRMTIAILGAGENGNPLQACANMVVQMAAEAIKAGWPEHAVVEMVTVHMLVARQMFREAAVAAGLEVVPQKQTADEIGQEIYNKVVGLVSAG